MSRFDALRLLKALSPSKGASPERLAGFDIPAASGLEAQHGNLAAIAIAPHSLRFSITIIFAIFVVR
jgi:hypothetical protein